jgi:DnaJ-class molecular chaperone
MSGTTKTINMLQTIVCPKCEGRKFVNGAVCSHCKGKGETTTYKKFNVKIPARIKNLSKIRLAGEGEKGINGGNNGDLYITIHIKETKSYKTDGLNILKTIPITPYEAVLGANVRISTLQGNLNIKIAPNTRNGQKIRLAGCGIVQNDVIGDMIVTVEIQIPKNLSEAEIKLYKKLAEISTSNIRDELYD